MQEKVQVNYSDDNHIYYNVNIYNNTNINQVARFEESRTVPLLKDPKMYHLSIIRLEIPTQAIPIFLWPNNPDGTPNNTFYQVALEDEAAGNIYFGDVVYNSATETHTFPQTEFFSNTSGYHGVWSYQNMIDAINSAFTVAFNNIPLARRGVIGINNPPYMIYNETTKLFSLIAEAGYVSSNPTPCNILFNPRLYFGFFDYFEVVDDANEYMRLLIKDNRNGNYDNVNMIYTMTQEQPSLYLWNDLRDLVIISNQIPIRSENVATLNASGRPVSLNILTDFEPLFGNTDIDRGVISYLPTAEYKMTDLISDVPLNRLDFNIFWQTKRQQLFPMMISPNTSITLKVLFRKKSLMN